MSTLLERLEYGFDRDSRRTWRKRTLTTGEDNAYTYDGLSQVVNAARGNLNLNATAVGGVPAETQAWDYDPIGNWRGFETKANGSVALDQARVHDKGNRLTQIEGAPNPVLLDRAGRMREVSPDAGGNWNESQQVKWDAWSRVTQVRRKSDGAVLGSYTYDGLTRRLTQSVGSTTTHIYYSDAWRPLEERRDSQTVPARQYYWGARHRDDLVRQNRATTSGGSLNETRYVLMDYFSPAAITDGSGVVKERYAFSAFGVRRILTPTFMDRATSECDFTFTFQGQFLDTESGYLNYGHRFYSPHLGRWLSKDPIAEEGGLNLYDMVANGALNETDFLGLLSLTDGVDTSLDEFTKKLLGPCGCKIGGDIPSFTPPPPPRPPEPPKKPNTPMDKPFRGTKGGTVGRGGGGGQLGDALLTDAAAVASVLEALMKSMWDAGTSLRVTQNYSNRNPSAPGGGSVTMEMNKYGVTLRAGAGAGIGSGTTFAIRMADGPTREGWNLQSNLGIGPISGSATYYKDYISTPTSNTTKFSLSIKPSATVTFGHTGYLWRFDD